MDKEALSRTMATFVDTSPLNRVAADRALRPELAGLRLFQHPILGCADAGDPFFGDLRRPEVVGPQFRLPPDWLDGAVTVVSFFLPFTDAIVLSNRDGIDWPSFEWLHGRIEGQAFIGGLCRHVLEFLAGQGIRAVAPCIDPSFKAWDKPPFTDETGAAVPGFTSTWSERHVAHAAGLGTFSLSAGLITSKGMAGRFGSLVTNHAFAVDPRPYTVYDEYCTRCGACIRRCPAEAISTAGKNHVPCHTFTRRVLARHQPWYGCGKCQVRVPCERGIPKRRLDRAPASQPPNSSGTTTSKEKSR